MLDRFAERADRFAEEDRSVLPVVHASVSAPAGLVVGRESSVARASVCEEVDWAFDPAALSAVKKQDRPVAE